MKRSESYFLYYGDADANLLAAALSEHTPDDMNFTIGPAEKVLTDDSGELVLDDDGEMISVTDPEALVIRFNKRIEGRRAASFLTIPRVLLHDAPGEEHLLRLATMIYGMAAHAFANIGPPPDRYAASSNTAAMSQ